MFSLKYKPLWVVWVGSFLICTLGLLLKIALIKMHFSTFYLLFSTSNSLEYIESQRGPNGTAYLPILMYTLGVGEGKGETMCYRLGVRCP